MIKMKTPPTEIMILYCCIISMFLYSEFSLYVKFIWSQALHKNLNIWASLSSSSLNQINVKDIFLKSPSRSTSWIQNACIFTFIRLRFHNVKGCKTLLCVSLLDFRLGNGKPSPNHKPYTSLHCLFYTESPTESKSSEERGRYRSCKTKGGTGLFTGLSQEPRGSLRSGVILVSNVIEPFRITEFG